MSKSYCVETAESMHELVENVNRMLEAGWILQGGICHSKETTLWTNERKGYEEAHTEELFMQAMVLPHDE